MPRIAFLGPEGTFTESALRQMISGDMVPGGGEVIGVPTDSTPAGLAAVRAGTVDYACVPIENSIDGSVSPTLDSLAVGTRLQIFAELTLDVAFSIVVRPDHTGDVETVAAFPVALAQVRQWLAANLPGARVVPAHSNAAAAADVAAGRADAGVSTVLAAERYRLRSLASGVVDEANARTRFVLVGPPAPPPARTGADRTSVALSVPNTPGALVNAMTELSIRDIDLTRIESRPTRTRLGSYVFFLDFVGHLDDDAVAEALKALHRRCADVRYLGSWPTGTAVGAVPPAGDDATRWLTGLGEGVDR
ncbi:prephenate dehydratase [Mycolicibacterium sp. S2-37]|uniref:prephenate dehydratase n=1 Tax=Mycolicibacterium sp. S2-37 TaxID=2810297 RepID=UPI001A94FF72|nr:prephenate dehydratase [Mycolicibacterium sp. S2-37]MBO0679800.1 prephenate dehydratase [Mycolicibacterium sp. S2-37]MBO0681197.1 prephenate dehydratase [Mycolicibacterium sp. S2-37]